MGKARERSSITMERERTPLVARGAMKADTPQNEANTTVVANDYTKNTQKITTRGKKMNEINSKTESRKEKHDIDGRDTLYHRT